MSHCFFSDNCSVFLCVFEGGVYAVMYQTCLHIAWTCLPCYCAVLQLEKQRKGKQSLFPLLFTGIFTSKNFIFGQNLYGIRKKMSLKSFFRFNIFIGCHPTLLHNLILSLYLNFSCYHKKICTTVQVIYWSPADFFLISSRQIQTDPSPRISNLKKHIASSIISITQKSHDRQVKSYIFFYKMLTLLWYKPYCLKVLCQIVAILSLCFELFVLLDILVSSKAANESWLTTAADYRRHHCYQQCVHIKSRSKKVKTLQWKYF